LHLYAAATLGFAAPVFENQKFPAGGCTESWENNARAAGRIVSVLILIALAASVGALMFVPSGGQG